MVVMVMVVTRMNRMRRRCGISCMFVFPDAKREPTTPAGLVHVTSIGILKLCVGM